MKGFRHMFFSIQTVFRGLESFIQLTLFVDYMLVCIFLDVDNFSGESSNHILNNLVSLVSTNMLSNRIEPSFTISAIILISIMSAIH